MIYHYKPQDKMNRKKIHSEKSYRSINIFGVEKKEKIENLIDLRIIEAQIAYVLKTITYQFI